MLDMRHLCEWCGTEMHGKRSDVLYCGAACKTAAYHDLERRARIEAKAGRPPCRQCGAAIPPAAEIRKAFCSRACKDAWRNARVGERFVAARAGRACVECGASLDHVRKDAIYCGARCRERAKQRRRTRSLSTD